MCAGILPSFRCCLATGDSASLTLHKASGTWLHVKLPEKASLPGGVSPSKRNTVQDQKTSIPTNSRAHFCPPRPASACAVNTSRPAPLFSPAMCTTTANTLPYSPSAGCNTFPILHVRTLVSNYPLSFTVVDFFLCGRQIPAVFSPYPISRRGQQRDENKVSAMTRAILSGLMCSLGQAVLVYAFTCLRPVL